MPQKIPDPIKNEPEKIHEEEKIIKPPQNIPENKEEEKITKPLPNQPKKIPDNADELIRIKPIKLPEDPKIKKPDSIPPEPKIEEIKPKPETKKEQRKKPEKKGLSRQAKLKIKKTLQEELNKRLSVLNYIFLGVIAFFIGNMALIYYQKD